MAGWTASGISDALINGLTGFSGGSMDPFYDIDPFDQREVGFNIMPVVNCASGEYVEKERMLAATNDDNNNVEFLPGPIRRDEST